MKSSLLIIWVTITAIVTFFFEPLKAQEQSIDRARRDLIMLNLQQVDAFLSVSSNTSESGFNELRLTRAFISLMLDQTKDNYRVFSDFTSQIDQKGKRSSSGSYTNEKFGILLHLFRGLAAAQFSEYKASSMEVYKAWRLFAKYEHDLEPLFRDQLRGFFTRLFQRLPDDWQKVLSVIGANTRGTDGFALLLRSYRASRPGTFEEAEAAIILLAALKEYQPDRRIVRQTLSGMNPELLKSPVIAYLYALCALKAGDNDKAFSILSDHQLKPASGVFPYWSYQLGRTRLYRGDPQASEDFKRFLGDGKPRNLRAAAIEKLAWHYLLTGETRLYARNVENLTRLDDVIHPQDVQSQREASLPENSDPDLLHLRLLLDGGYYERLIGEGQQMMQSGRYQGWQQALIHYRLGRAYHLSGDLRLAEAHYRLVLDMQKVISSYWLPNSALQLGLILMVEGKNAQAKEALEECLRLNRYGYQESIKAEAERALRQIR